MNKQIVHIIDDDYAILNAIKALVKSEGLKARTYSSAFNFLESYDASPGCLVVDLRMPKMNGIELQKKLKKIGDTLPIIFLTGYGDVSIAVEAMKAGAVDFIQKPYVEQNLLESIFSALKVDRDNRNLLSGNNNAAEKISSLTAREHEIMNMLAKSQTNKEIARILDISSRTVEVHRRNIMTKLDIKSVLELSKLIK